MRERGNRRVNWEKKLKRIKRIRRINLGNRLPKIRRIKIEFSKRIRMIRLQKRNLNRFLFCIINFRIFLSRSYL